VEPRDVVDIPRQVQVTTHKHNEIQHLCLKGDSCRCQRRIQSTVPAQDLWRLILCISTTKLRRWSISPMTRNIFMANIVL
jgi:hypothetical protein